MPCNIKTGDETLDEFFFDSKLDKGSIIEMNYTDEETKNHLMIHFLVEFMTQDLESDNTGDIKQKLDMKS